MNSMEENVQNLNKTVDKLQHKLNELQINCLSLDKKSRRQIDSSSDDDDDDEDFPIENVSQLIEFEKMLKTQKEHRKKLVLF